MNSSDERRLLQTSQLGMLLRPCPRQRLKQIIKLKRARLAAGQNCLDNVWRDQGQPQDPAYIGIVDLLGPRKICRAIVLPAFEHLPPAMRADDGFDEGGV